MSASTQPSMLRPERSTGIVGRDRELAEIIAHLQRPDRRFLGAVVSGEPGIGKTTVLRAAVAAFEANGALLLRAGPAERERELPFAVLQDLLRTVPSALLDRLPGPQRAALAVVRLEEQPPPTGIDARTIGTAVVNATVALAESAAVLIVVDDLQWIDRPSADALAFAIRRLGDSRVRVLVGRRDGVGVDLDVESPSWLRINLAELPASALYAVLRSELDHPFPGPQLDLIRAWSGGNPLLAIEAGRWLLAHPGDDALITGVPPRLPAESLLGDRIRGLHEGVFRTLLIVALAGRIREDDLAAVGRRLGWPVGRPSADSGLLAKLEGEELRLGHPLLAGHVVSESTAADRRQIHAALATLAADPVRRARHLAFAADGEDERVATTIAEAANLAEASGALHDALALIELSARLTPRSSVDVLQQRHLVLGDLALRVGDVVRARAALSSASLGPTPEIAFQALIQILRPSFGAAPEERRDAARKARALARGNARALAEVALVLPGTEHDGHRHASAARRLLERCAPDALLARAIAFEAASATELGRPYPMERLDRAVELERGSRVTSVNSTAAAIRAWIRSFSDDHASSRAEFRELRARAEALGDEASLPSILRNLGHLEIRAGAWDEAQRVASQTIAVGERTGQQGSVAMGHLQLGAVAALRGDAEVASAELRLAGEIGDRAGQPFVGGLAAGRLGVLHLSIGEPEAAVEEFERSRQILSGWGMLDPALTNWRGEHVEALAALGRVEEARAVIEGLERSVVGRERPVSVAIVDRSRALLAAAGGALDAASAAAARSVEILRGRQDPYELARSLHVAGSIERRRRRKAEAATHLEEAIAILDGLGATAWSLRVREELRRVGLRPRASKGLTETELLVAQLAATGLTNRQVGDRAFLSPRTVEDVLVRVYAKLGIASRAELGAAMAAHSGD